MLHCIIYRTASSHIPDIYLYSCLYSSYESIYGKRQRTSEKECGEHDIGNTLLSNRRAIISLKSKLLLHINMQQNRETHKGVGRHVQGDKYTCNFCGTSYSCGKSTGPKQCEFSESIIKFISYFIRG